MGDSPKPQNPKKWKHIENFWKNTIFDMHKTELIFASVRSVAQKLKLWKKHEINRTLILRKFWLLIIFKKWLLINHQNARDFRGSFSTTSNLRKQLGSHRHRAPRNHSAYGCPCSACFRLQTSCQIEVKKWHSFDWLAQSQISEYAKRKCHLKTSHRK